MNKKQVIEKIGKSRWKAFSDFMKGQTVEINTDGSTEYYEWDVENFLRPEKRRFSD